MNDYKSYMLKNLGIRENIPVDIGNVDPNELKTGIKVEMEHTQDERIARKIALDHLKEDPKYYSRMEKCGLKESSPFMSLLSPTAKSPQTISLSVRGTPNGNLPSIDVQTNQKVKQSGVNTNSRAALGGLEPIDVESPNSILVDKTPVNQNIISPQPISMDQTEECSIEKHPHQIQKDNNTSLMEDNKKINKKNLKILKEHFNNKKKLTEKERMLLSKVEKLYNK